MKRHKPKMQRIYVKLIKFGIGPSLNQLRKVAQHYKYELRNGECTVALWRKSDEGRTAEIWCGVRDYLSFKRNTDDDTIYRYKLLVFRDSSGEFTFY